MSATEVTKLTRTHRILIGLVVAGAVVIAGIGFAGSYSAVRDLALKKGFGGFADVLPIGIDAGIVVLLALDLLLTWMRIPFPLLRQTAWLLTAATIAFNGAAAWPDPLGVGMHAVIPVLFVVSVEAARHAVGRIADITADRHMEGVRLTRWLLSPVPTFRLWRRMKLWELRSYEQVIQLEQDRLVYRARLQARYGRAWRRKAPVESLMPLRLARFGVPLSETGPAGLASAGINPAPPALPMPSTPLPATQQRPAIAAAAEPLPHEQPAAGAAEAAPAGGAPTGATPAGAAPATAGEQQPAAAGQGPAGAGPADAEQGIVATGQAAVNGQAPAVEQASDAGQHPGAAHGAAAGQAAVNGQAPAPQQIQQAQQFQQVQQAQQVHQAQQIQQAQQAQQVRTSEQPSGTPQAPAAPQPPQPPQQAQYAPQAPVGPQQNQQPQYAEHAPQQNQQHQQNPQGDHPTHHQAQYAAQQNQQAQQHQQAQYAEAAPATQQFPATGQATAAGQPQYASHQPAAEEHRQAYGHGAPAPVQAPAEATPAAEPHVNPWFVAPPTAPAPAPAPEHADYEQEQEQQEEAADEDAHQEQLFSAYRRYRESNGEFPNARQLGRHLADVDGVTSESGGPLTEGELRGFLRDFRHRYRSEADADSAH